MPRKTYTVRVPAATPEVGSEIASAWLDAQLSSDKPLAADPGAGDRTLRLSLEQEKVKAGADAVGEVEAVFLRRLIASNVPVSEEQKETGGETQSARVKGCPTATCRTSQTIGADLRGSSVLCNPSCDEGP